LRTFYDSLEKDIDKFEKEIDKIKNRRIVSDVLDSEGNPMILKTGLYGKYLISETNENEKISLKGIAISPEALKKGEVIVKEEVEKLQNNKKGILTDDRKIIEEAGTCEFCGKPYEIKTGRFGKFLACTGYPECKTIKNIKTGKVTRVTEKAEKAKKTTKKATKKTTVKTKSASTKARKTAATRKSTAKKSK